jgi:hypothetical protein
MDDEPRIITVGKAHPPTEAEAKHDMYGKSTVASNSDRSFCETFEVSVYMAGDIEHAKQVIRRYCNSHPCCVTVTPTAYIYRGGEESGFVVTFRNYPRHTSEGCTLEDQGRDLGLLLRGELGQDSFMVVSPRGTMLNSVRGKP